MKKIVVGVLVAVMFALPFGEAQADDKVLRLITWTGYAPPELIEN